VAEHLKEAGLKRVNISLDTLKPEVAQKIAQKDVLSRVLEGIEAAQKAGLQVKLNMVPLQGVNDDEILDLLAFARERGMTIRFIEYMENAHAHNQLKGISGSEVLTRIKAKYRVKDEGFDGHSPSRYYSLDDGYRFGIIEPYGDDFCKTCNRIRLTAEGHLIPCLYFDEALSIKEAVRKGDIAAAAEVLREVVRTKPEKNRWSGEDGEASSRAFYETGG